MLFGYFSYGFLIDEHGGEVVHSLWYVTPSLSH